MRWTVCDETMRVFISMIAAKLHVRGRHKRLEQKARAPRCWRRLTAVPCVFGSGYSGPAGRPWAARLLTSRPPKPWY